MMYREVSVGSFQTVTNVFGAGMKADLGDGLARSGMLWIQDLEPSLLIGVNNPFRESGTPVTCELD